MGVWGIEEGEWQQAGGLGQGQGFVQRLMIGLCLGQRFVRQGQSV